MIDWQATVTRLDVDPEIASASGQTVLKQLLGAGAQYESAGQPDVMYESDAHRQWLSLPASKRVGTTEPPYFITEYYSRPVSRRSGKSGLLVRDPKMPDSAPKDAKEAYAFWRKIDLAVARRIATYYIAEAEEEERQRTASKGPPLGAIQNSLIAAVTAAEAWLAS